MLQMIRIASAASSAVAKAISTPRPFPPTNSTDSKVTFRFWPVLFSSPLSRRRRGRMVLAVARMSRMIRLENMIWQKRVPCFRVRLAISRSLQTISNQLSTVLLIIKVLIFQMKSDHDTWWNLQITYAYVIWQLWHVFWGKVDDLRWISWKNKRIRQDLISWFSGNDSKRNKPRYHAFCFIYDNIIILDFTYLVHYYTNLKHLQIWKQIRIT